jgi:hypothetical protein
VHAVTPLNVQDLFALGLGFDVAGGYLVARGLFADDADIATMRTIRAVGGAQQVVRAVSDRADASLGLANLGLGFILQAIGYLSEEAGAQTGSTGTRPALAFAATTCVAVIAALAVHRNVVPGRVRRMSLRVMLLDGTGSPRAQPDGRDLMELGIELGDDAIDGESYGGYARRVWGFGSVERADEVPNEDARHRQVGRRLRR